MTEYNGTNIEYTKGDGFYIEITSDEGFAEGDILEFTVSPSELASSVIYKEIPLSTDRFCITLTEDEIALLSINDYIYKIAVVSELCGRVTHKSGLFRVKWGE